MKVMVLSRDGLEVINGGLVMPDESTVGDLNQAIHEISSQKYSVWRIRLSLPLQPGQEKATVLESSKRLDDYIDINTSTSRDKQLRVVFKDLGPQISYRKLFLWEYLGPLLIYPIFYYAPSLYTIFFSVAPRAVTHPAQRLAFWFWTLHYIKRILETYFVHRFSHPSAPIKMLYINCVYYWPFAVAISYAINHPSYKPVGSRQMYIGFALGVVFEVANLYCHVVLKRLRSTDGKGGYQIPRGFLFDFITCPNYTTEFCAWIGFNIATQTVIGYAFMLFGARTMAMWGLGKHIRLEKMYDGKLGREKYPKRWVMIPPFF